MNIKSYLFIKLIFIFYKGYIVVFNNYLVINLSVSSSYFLITLLCLICNHTSSDHGILIRHTTLISYWLSNLLLSKVLLSLLCGNKPLISSCHLFRFINPLFELLNEFSKWSKFPLID